MSGSTTTPERLPPAESFAQLADRFQSLANADLQVQRLTIQIAAYSITAGQLLLRAAENDALAGDPWWDPKGPGSDFRTDRKGPWDFKDDAERHEMLWDFAVRCWLEELYPGEPRYRGGELAWKHKWWNPEKKTIECREEAYTEADALQHAKALAFAYADACGLLSRALEHFTASRARSVTPLRVLFAEPVFKRAIRRIKKRDRQMADHLRMLEASVLSDDYDEEKEVSAADHIALERIFGNPTELRQKTKEDPHVREFLAVFAIAEEEFRSEWQNKTGEIPPRWKTIDELEQVLAWWKEKAAFVGIDPNAILAAQDHEVLAWEPVIRGCLNLLKLQAATVERFGPNLTASCKDNIEKIAEGIKSRLVKRTSTETSELTGWISPADVAGTYGLTDKQKERLRGRLRRFAKGHATAWDKVKYRESPHQAQIIYDYSVVKSLIEEFLRDIGKTT